MKQGLSLGSGFARMKNSEDLEWTHLDNDVSCQPDIHRNILQGIPFNDDTFDIVYCSHFLEHFSGEDFIFIMNEIHRVLKPHGELHVLSPYYKNPRAFQDPNHKMFFTEFAFEPWWFPSQSSVSTGVKGWFYPVVLEVAEELEIRCVMKKIPREQISGYVDTIGVLKGERREAPDWLERLKGSKYYG